MDFTPVTFSDAKYPHQTTNAHELALSVIFETAIQHFADSADSYRAQPEAVKTFLKQVPTAWDETKVLSGEPGQTLVIARRSGDVWYVGGINGTAETQTVVVATDFVGPAWTGTFIEDGATPRTFSITMGGRVPGAGGTRAGGAPLHAKMLPHGGFVMRLTK
jgi:hypothetical protein